MTTRTLGQLRDIALRAARRSADRRHRATMRALRARAIAADYRRIARIADPPIAARARELATLYAMRAMAWVAISRADAEMALILCRASHDYRRAAGISPRVWVGRMQ